MMNEGLDALATLASTSPSAPAWGNLGLNNNNYSSQRTNENPFSAHGSNGNTPASTTGSTAAAPAGSHSPFSTSNLMQMLQNGSLSQLQQALQQCGNGMNASALSNSNLALLMGMRQQSQPQPQEDQLALLQQQLSYYRGNMNSQSGNQINVGTGDRRVQQANTTSFEPHQALALSQALQAHQRAQHNDGSQPSNTRTQHQVLPLNNSQAPMEDFTSSLSAGSISMPPPKSAPTASYCKVSTVGVPSPNRPGKIAPQHSMDMPGLGENESSFEQLSQGQKVLKRAANRKSAQLSRKRKKQCIEELHEENNDLRRKDQILRAIPDLIVVFDSAGKLWFVSESVSMFLGMPAHELEGTSFWDCLCEDSVRLLKAAFMDSLAAREPDSDSVSLGAGVWELRLVDKNGSDKIVTLNGVVHFAGDRPECVCSIRPVHDKAAEANTASKAAETVSDPKAFTFRNHVKPQQSVVSSSSDNSSTRKHKRQTGSRINEREIVRTSSSSDCESGSTEGMIPSP